MAILAGLLGPDAAEAAGRKKRKPTPTRTPTRTATPRPTTIPLLRAAGSCVVYEPGQSLVVAEVGEAGHVFRIDAETVVEAPRLEKGTRVRILYLETPEGPLARRVLPGPVVAAPAPRK